MGIYLNPKLVELSFKRLSPISSAGKKPLERTSSLMYFLAFDAAVKSLDCRPLDLNPKSTTGKDHRRAMELEYSRLVQLKTSNDKKVRHVVVLGKVEKGGNPPDKRISSNFFTVPVKKASESAKMYNYPNRPAPLLKMGNAATQVKWGIDYHDNWRTSLPKFLSELKGNTPFTDIAIFVCRNDTLPDSSDKVRDALASVITDRFTEDLATFWIRRMESEKVFFKHGDDPFRDSYEEPLSEESLKEEPQVSDTETLMSLDKDVLVQRIVYLEGLLEAQEIEYQSITE